MTNEDLARQFLSRFPAQEDDILEMAAMLSAAEEEGAARKAWDRDEKTVPSAAVVTS